MKKINFFFIYIIFNIFFVLNFAYSETESFEIWLESFKIIALKKGISKKTFDQTMSNVKFLPKVIEYDRHQPESYEDTITYITKRTSEKKIKSGVKLFNENKLLINYIDKKFSVEKELLLALMGIETNFGKYLGKMDIVSSLATLSFDKRRSEFFSKELLILLKLIDKDIIDPKTLYGSWAGAFGNFQFMPRTIKNYAIDYNKNSIIELKDIDDSFASAANYLNKQGWKIHQPCFYKIELKNNVPEKYLNTSAKKIHNKKKLFYFENYIHNYNEIDLNKNILTAIVTPDKNIIPDAENLSPAYLIFNNYELLLKWNRSLRFALAVCTLKNEIKNAL